MSGRPAGDGTGRAIVDGRAVPLARAHLAITDDGAVRGDGAFETIGVWSGLPFRLEDHLRRLRGSLASLGLPPPDTGAIAAEVDALLVGLGPRDATLRVYATAGGTRVVALVDQPQRREPGHLVPLPGPWIRPLDAGYGPAGAKSMSYAPNMAATRAAQAAGGDDALLVASEGWVLEGPTFAVLWVAGGVLRAPDVGLGVVDSISRRTLMRLAAVAGHPTEEGRWTLDELGRADEVMVCSAVRDVIAVGRVGEHRFGGRTPVRDRLAEALEGERRRHAHR